MNRPKKELAGRCPASGSAPTVPLGIGWAGQCYWPNRASGSSHCLSLHALHLHFKHFCKSELGPSPA